MTHEDPTPSVETGSELRANEARVDALLARRWRLTIDGESADAADGRVYDVVSPFTECVIARVPDASRVDAERAVDSAHAAFRSWRRLSVPERATFVTRIADAIEQNLKDFALLDAIDSGAPVTTMLFDAANAVRSLRYFAGIAMEAKGETIPASENLHYTLKQPFGVVGKIVPFNHPFLFAASKIGAPLVAGNTVVLKPSESTPLSALLLGELAAGILPPGVLNVVVGDGPDVPDAIVRHPAVHRISFTGSEAVGRAIQRSAAEAGVKTVSLELGGKNALIACDDADPAVVAQAAVDGMNFTWSGQSCGSTSRLLVHESIADEVLDRIQDLLRGRVYLSPLDPRSIQGTMVSRRQYDRAISYIDAAQADGARVVVGGGRPPGVAEGLFIAPTYLDRVSPDSAVATEEIFGPVVSVVRWTDEEDALRIANSLDYGLTGAVFTNDLARAHRVVRELEAGFVWVNTVAAHYQGIPYGGWKASGIGTEEDLGELLSYVQTKAVTIRL